MTSLDTSLRHGIVILTDQPWAEAAPKWRAAEELGFDHAWTYDHLIWSGLHGHPWRGALPTLAAAAGITSTIGLGTLVSSPNYRHPYAFLRDVLALADISGARYLCGLGAGGNVDAEVLGASYSLKERVDRFHEFVRTLDRLLREDDVTIAGEWYSTVGASTLPGPARAEVPLYVAANGPRSVRLAAEVGDAWVTYGGRGETVAQWWSHLTELMERFEAAEAVAGRSGVRRVLSMDSGPQFSLASAQVYADLTGRAAELGFTDVITHWPRPEGPYAGDPAVLERLF